MRATMYQLVAQVRLLIGDPASNDATFSDDELQMFLDNQGFTVLYQPLTAEPAIAPGGGTAYYAWFAPVGWWESDESLTDASYNVLTPTSSDRQRGRWVFGTSQNDVLLTGRYYDVHLAAADAVDAWLAKLKLAYDFAADGGDYKRSQMVIGLQALASSLRAKAGNGGVQTATMSRWDA